MLIGREFQTGQMRTKEESRKNGQKEDEGQDQANHDE